MKKSFGRVLAGTALAVVLTGLVGGVADAAPLAAADVPVRLLPGVDAGSLLDPVVGVPAGALAPVAGLLTFLG